MNRRQFIVATGSAAALGIAGCLGGDDGGSDTESPEAVVEAWYNLRESSGGQNRGDVQDEAETLIHSESPLLQLQQGGNESQEVEDPDISLDSLDTEVLQENLSGSELESEFPILFASGSGTRSTISEEGQAAIAEENAIVEARVQYSGEDIPQGQLNLTGRWLVATESGEWQLVESTTVGQN